MKKLLNCSDVLIEPFRKGVMESVGLGPDDVMKTNPKLIYARLTGFGQNGAFAKMAGHDINYVAMSGILSLLGRANEKPTPPINILADFGGGGLMCALGIALALLEREKSGQGQIIDAAMVDGTAYLSSWIFRSQNLPIWGNSKGNNILDTGSHFYDTFETKDGKFMAVGALEANFHDILLEKLQLRDIPHFSNFEENKEKLSEAFKTKSRDEWCQIFDGTDACVTPVLTPEEAVNHPHNIERQTFSVKNETIIPNPAPKLSRTPGKASGVEAAVENGAHTKEILLGLGYSSSDIEKLHADGVVKTCNEQSKL